MKKKILCGIILLMSIFFVTLSINSKKDVNSFRMESPSFINHTPIDESNLKDSVFHIGKVVKEELLFENINHKDVRVSFMLLRSDQESFNNPTFAQAEIIYNAIRYKMMYPEKKVEIKISSFHFSVLASAAVNPNSSNYGKVKGLGYEDFDSEGFVRLAYLLVLAAKHEINVEVLGQLSSPDAKVKNKQGKIVTVKDIPILEYFESFYDEETINESSSYKVKDFLHVINSKWTSYGDRPASDLMHYKYLYVSGIVDRNNRVHENVSLYTSQNIDSIDYKGLNTGNNSSNTGVIVINHEILSRVSNNYFDILFKHSNNQEDAYLFRKKINNLNREQFELYQNDLSHQIKKDDQILYLGTDEDLVFEMYFTPTGSSPGAFDIDLNPFAKYTFKSLNSQSFVEIQLFITKFVESSFVNTWSRIIEQSILNANNINSVFLISQTPYYKFEKIIEGVNVRKKIMNYDYPHTKDLLISYKTFEERQYITVHSSTNSHEGAFTHQANFMLVIKDKTFYTNYLKHNPF